MIKKNSIRRVLIGEAPFQVLEFEVHLIVVVTDDLSFHFRLQMHDKAVKLYAELAEVAVNSFLISKDSLVDEPVRIHNGAEENKEALRKSRGGRG